MLRSFLILAMALASAGPALAQDASAANSTAPACIVLVGRAGSVPAAALGEFTVIVRDLANNPVPGALVVVDLSGCPDLHICTDQMDAAMAVDCANQRVSKIADANGTVHMTILGGSNGAGGASELLSAGQIFENGNLIKRPTVSAFDLDGSLGLGANDFSTFYTDFATGVTYGRSDFDCSGNLGANDLSLWLTAYASGTMVESCAASCP